MRCKRKDRRGDGPALFMLYANVPLSMSLVFQLDDDNWILCSGVSSSLDFHLCGFLTNLQDAISQDNQNKLYNFTAKKYAIAIASLKKACFRGL